MYYDPKLKKVNPLKRGKGVPKRLFHTSPWLMKVGTYIHPKWSAHQYIHKVWLTPSYREVVGLGKNLIKDLREGKGGFCGTGNRTDFAPQEIYGTWIYRVKPTGLIENWVENHWVSSFPVKVIELTGKIGEPERNNLTLPMVKRTDEEIARISLGPCNPEALIEAFEQGKTKKDKIICMMFTSYFGEACALELVQLLSNCPKADRVERIISLYKTKIREEKIKFEKLRLKYIHKLSPDPRYKRDKSWKKQVYRDLSE